MHLNKNPDDEKPLREESEDENVPVGVEPRVPCHRDENGAPAQSGAPEEDWPEEKLRLIAFQMASPAIVALRFGLRSRIQIEHVPNSLSNQERIEGWCTPVSTFTEQAEEMIRKASEEFETTGECDPLYLDEDAFVVLTEREIAAVCIAGRIAAWMLPAGGEAVSASNVLYSLEYDPLSESVQQEIEVAFPDGNEHSEILWLIEETMFSLWEDWNLVNGLAEHLIQLFHEDGVAVLTDDMLVKVVSELHGERAEPIRVEIENSDLNV